MRYLCHAFQRATQAELRVRVAYRGAFSALKFPSTRTLSIDKRKGGNATKEAGYFFLIAVD